ncbi:RNA-directed DNA polymerase, eukaryota, reverse transcriptase zinc-binding domain protein, partial [Tanacetum coccineum]
DTYPILLSFTHCGNKSILRVLRIILVILPEHPSETIVFHNEDGNPARANIKQALGYLKDGDGDGNSQPHKGVKASANSDVKYSFTSAQDGEPLQDDVRLCLGNDLKKAQDHSQRHVHFFNGHDISSKKVSWVNWNKVIASKDKGGLGVSSLYALNRGLLFKLIWRFLTQGSSLWAKVIKAIHGVDGNLGSNSKGGMKSCWSSIVTEVNALANKGIDLMQFLRIKMGNGDSIRLWEDPWHEGGILKLRYPRVYALEMCKSITIGGKLAHPNLSDSFRRYPRGGAEFSQFGEFSALMHQVIRAPMADRWMWTRNSSGEFTVASVRQFIDDKICIGGDHKTTWIRFIPNKVNIHAWKVMLNALPTKFNISRRGIQIDSIICVNCGIGVETTNHLFFTCEMAQKVSHLINRWWDVPDSEFDSYASWKVWVTNIRLPGKTKLMFEGIEVKPHLVGMIGLKIQTLLSLDLSLASKPYPPFEQVVEISLWERLGKAAMLNIELSSFSWDMLSSLHHTEHSSSNEHPKFNLLAAASANRMVVVVICEHTMTMANTTTSDPEKAITAATSNLKGEDAQQGIMHAAQYTSAIIKL